jgi:uncharacterized protein (DUF488 family)
MEQVIHTIGSSNRTIGEFLDLLKKYNIECLIDVRRFPTSKFEHFKKENLKEFVEREGIEYVYLGQILGGYRSGGYEKYMHTEAFLNGIKQIEIHVKDKKSAIMCCERLPWRCHRRFISMQLESRGWEVIHIIDEKRIWKPRSKRYCQKNS